MRVLKQMEQPERPLDVASLALGLAALEESYLSLEAIDIQSGTALSYSNTKA